MPSSNLLALFALLLVFVSCATTFAETPQDSIPQSIDLKMGARMLKFEHQKHIKSVDSICIYCHLNEMGKIDGGFGNDAARLLCIPCHDKEPNVNTDCKGCHPAVKAITSK